MKRFDYRILVGCLLILFGILMLLDRSGILRGATDLGWAVLLAVAAAVFLFYFFSDRSKWWAAIPGFALAGMAASSLLLDRIGWGGAAFLGGLGVGFWAIYLFERTRWWAIIPGGVLLSLAASSALSEAYHFLDTGGVFMVGLGITFLLVALLARSRWAFIPAAVLFLVGFLIGTPFVGVTEYFWIGLLMVLGVVMIVSSFTMK